MVGCYRAHQLDFKSGDLQGPKFDNQSDDLATNWQREPCQNLWFSCRTLLVLPKVCSALAHQKGSNFPQDCCQNMLETSRNWTGVLHAEL